MISRAIKRWLSDPAEFSRAVLKRPLRQYQLEPARAILDSILHGRGLSFVVMMSRQAGKNELSGQLEAYLLNLFQRRGGQIVKASPTYKPQTINSLLRLADRLNNPWNRGRWQRREGYIVQLGLARALFFSADPHANVVGATADLLLECDEAQDVQPTKWEKDFVPMAASSNGTTVFWGTAWTSDTLLAQTATHLQHLHSRDGIRRVFRVDADQVGAEVPTYRNFVDAQVRKLGRTHPLIKTQYYLEEIDGEGGLFPVIRRSLMMGDHLRQLSPTPGHRYAFLIDVAGEDEQEGDALDRAMLGNKKRDATALTIVEVDHTYGRLPTYRTVHRLLWLGRKHSLLHDILLDLERRWHPVWVVIDATGVGAGMASFLAKALGPRLIPLIFSAKTKSDLGWNFVGIVETGRYRDYCIDDDQITRQFWYEVEACQYQVAPGPGQTMRWGVWETPAYDGMIAYGHDDLLISAAMCAVLDQQEWPGTGTSAVVQQADPLHDIDQAKW